MTNALTLVSSCARNPTELASATGFNQYFATLSPVQHGYAAVLLNFSAEKEKPESELLEHLWHQVSLPTLAGS
jgi:hypothetical protein